MEGSDRLRKICAEAADRIHIIAGASEPSSQTALWGYSHNSVSMCRKKEHSSFAFQTVPCRIWSKFEDASVLDVWNRLLVVSRLSLCRYKAGGKTDLRYLQTFQMQVGALKSGFIGCYMTQMMWRWGWAMINLVQTSRFARANEYERITSRERHWLARKKKAGDDVLRMRRIFVHFYHSITLSSNPARSLMQPSELSSLHPFYPILLCRFSELKIQITFFKRH